MLESTLVLPAYAPLAAHAVASRLVGTCEHKDMIRGFYHLKESWYGDVNLKDSTDNAVDSISIGFFSPTGDGGTTGEFCVQWINLQGISHPQLQVFGDAWEALTHFSDLLAEMAKIKNNRPSPSGFCEILKRLGIKDLTKRERP